MRFTTGMEKFQMSQLTADSADAIEEKIRRVLRELGIPEHLNGFWYLVDAVRLVLQQPELMKRITAALYPAVAKRNHTTAAGAERAMRHAIETGWSRCDPDAALFYFGNSIDPQRGKPVNSEFIARVSSAVCQEEFL